MSRHKKLLEYVIKEIAEKNFGLQDSKISFIPRFRRQVRKEFVRRLEKGKHPGGPVAYANSKRNNLVFTSKGIANPTSLGKGYGSPSKRTGTELSRIVAHEIGHRVLETGNEDKVKVFDTLWAPKVQEQMKNLLNNIKPGEGERIFKKIGKAEILDPSKEWEVLKKLEQKYTEIYNLQRGTNSTNTLDALINLNKLKARKLELMKLKSAGWQAELYKELKPQILEALNLRKLKETKNFEFKGPLTAFDQTKFYDTKANNWAKATDVEQIVEQGKHPLWDYFSKFDGPIPKEFDKHFSKSYTGAQRTLQTQRYKKAGFIDKVVKRGKIKNLENLKIPNALNSGKEKTLQELLIDATRNPKQTGVISAKVDWNTGEVLGWDKKASWQETKDYVKSNYDYGSYLLRHKYNIMRAGTQLDLPFIQLAVHDYNKFSPKRWDLYRQWFATNKGRNGERDPVLYRKFRHVADQHLHSVPYGHHWYRNKTPIEKVPLEYRLESLADWYSVYAGNFKGPGKKETFSQWYKKRRDRLPLDPAAKQVADQKLIYKVARLDHTLRAILKSDPAFLKNIKFKREEVNSVSPHSPSSLSFTSTYNTDSNKYIAHKFDAIHSVKNQRSPVPQALHEIGHIQDQAKSLGSRRNLSKIETILTSLAPRVTKQILREETGANLQALKLIKKHSKTPKMDALVYKLKALPWFETYLPTRKSRQDINAKRGLKLLKLL